LTSFLPWLTGASTKNVVELHLGTLLTRATLIALLFSSSSSSLPLPLSSLLLALVVFLGLQL
jgi:hypothetical protein